MLQCRSISRAHTQSRHRNPVRGRFAAQEHPVERVFPRSCPIDITIYIVRLDFSQSPFFDVISDTVRIEVPFLCLPPLDARSRFIVSFENYSAITRKLAGKWARFRSLIQDSLTFILRICPENDANQTSNPAIAWPACCISYIANA